MTMFLTLALAALPASLAAAQPLPAPLPVARPAPMMQVDPSLSPSLVDPQLSPRKITVNTGSFQGPLSVLLAGIAKAGGYEVVFDLNVDALPLVTSASGKAELSAKPLAYSLAGQPFNQVWPLLMDVHGLSYTTIKVGSQAVLRVGNAPVQRSFAVPVAQRNPELVQRLRSFFGTEEKTTTASQTQTDENGTVKSNSERKDAPVQITYKLNSPTLQIQSDPSTSVILVRGTNAEVREVERVLRELMNAYASGNIKPAPKPVPTTSEVFTIYGNADAVKGVLASEYPSLQVLAIPGAAGEPTQLIVKGPAAEVDKALGLLGRIDRKPEPAPVVKVEPAPPAPVREQRIYAVRGESADVQRLLADQFPLIKVTPVSGGSSLVISGEVSVLNTAQALLVQVDRPAVPVPVRDPAPVAPTEQQIYQVKGEQGDVTTLLASRFPQLKVTPVGKTGQLIINGTGVELASALGLLSQVDRAPVAPVSNEPVITQRVFQLINSSAEEVKETLEGTLARTLTQAAPAQVPVTRTDASGNAVTVLEPAPAPAVTAGAPAASSAPRVSVVADKRTNILIVRGTAEQVAQVAELIPGLDQKVPQINVKVRIQEITDTARRSLGLNWGVNVGGFTIGSSDTAGLTASFDPTRTSLGFNILPSLSALETQGLTKRVYDGSVTMQSGQRSLNTAGTTQNASSTAAATVKSGGRLELNIPSTSGNIEKQIDYGVILDFFNPQVAPDGTITLRVRGQVTGEPVIPESGLPNLLRFSNSEAQSTLTLKDGQSVVLAGLMSTTQGNTRSGTPFLSSLPVIGAVFGKTTKVNEETQLLVVITADVTK